MSVGPDPASKDAPSRIDAAAWAEQARGRADARLAVTIADFFLDADARLDERTRLRLAQVLDGIVGAIETDIRRHAARLLANAGDPARGEAILKPGKPGGSVVARLTRARLLHDDALMGELIARVRHDLIADALPVAISGPDESSLLVRLAGVPDSVVASAANALLASESRRRSANEAGTIAGSDLPAELHHRLVWWIAAAIREGDGRGATVDRALVDAALRSLSAHDEGERPEAVAMRLAGAIEARPDELAALLIEAIGDRRLSLFVAVLARAIGVDFEQARRMTIEPDGDQLWIALRAADLDRSTIARIALALSEADPRRDIEAFADSLGAIAAISAPDARAALAPLSLHRDFRAAMRALARSERR